MLKKTTASEEETQSFGQNFAKSLKNKVIILYGDLGSGKTTFVKGLAKGLKVKEEITSPTFVLYKPYVCQDGSRGTLYHFDLYRLEDSSELEELGFAEIISNPKNTIVVEWPEKATSLLPKRTTEIHFTHGEKPNERLIEIKND